MYGYVSHVYVYRNHVDVDHIVICLYLIKICLFYQCLGRINKTRASHLDDDNRIVQYLLSVWVQIQIRWRAGNVDWQTLLSTMHSSYKMRLPPTPCQKLCLLFWYFSEVMALLNDFASLLSTRQKQLRKKTQTSYRPIKNS